MILTKSSFNAKIKFIMKIVFLLFLLLIFFLAFVISPKKNRHEKNIHNSKKPETL